MKKIDETPLPDHGETDRDLLSLIAQALKGRPIIDQRLYREIRYTHRPTLEPFDRRPRAAWLLTVKERLTRSGRLRSATWNPVDERIESESAADRFRVLDREWEQMIQQLAQIHRRREKRPGRGQIEGDKHLNRAAQELCYVACSRTDPDADWPTCRGILRAYLLDKTRWYHGRVGRSPAPKGAPSA